MLNHEQILKMLAYPNLNPTKQDFSHHLLIATPNITDGIFAQSLIYLCRHDNQGILGLIINKQNPFVHMAKLLEDLHIAVTTNELYQRRPLLSGPLNPEVGFLLHTGQPNWASSFVVSENICITTSRDILHNIGSGGSVSHFELCLGHASWVKGQLEQEIVRGDWLLCPANHEILFDTPYDERWQRACDLLGVNFDIFSSEIGRA